MTDSKTLAAGFVLELRSPLSRVELAVSQLLRESHTPVVMELAETISAAVRQADRDINRIISLLLPLAPARRRRDDLGTVLSSLCQRIAPVLEARGTACEARVPECGPLPGDPVFFERATLALIRVGCVVVGVGGCVSLGLVRKGSKSGVVIECRAAAGRSFESDPERAFARLLPLAVSHGGELENAAVGKDWLTTMWFPEDEKCLAS